MDANSTEDRKRQVDHQVYRLYKVEIQPVSYYE